MPTLTVNYNKQLSFVPGQRVHIKSDPDKRGTVQEISSVSSFDTFVWEIEKTPVIDTDGFYMTILMDDGKYFYLPIEGAADKFESERYFTTRVPILTRVPEYSYWAEYISTYKNHRINIFREADGSFSLSVDGCDIPFPAGLKNEQDILAYAKHEIDTEDNDE